MKSLDINNFFDRVYYINMWKDYDRNLHILDQFKKFNITNYEKVEGVEVKDIPNISLYRNFIKRDECYIQGALGCRAAHLNIIKDAIAKGYEKICIFEDDVEFRVDPNILIHHNFLSIENFDLLYFGGLQEQVFNNQIVQTHAMGINSRIFQDILYMAEASGMEIDNFYAKIIQQMSKNNRIGGKCLVKKVEPFNSVIQSPKFNSNIRKEQH